MLLVKIELEQGQPVVRTHIDSLTHISWVEKEKRTIAVHEVGHALVAILTPDCDPLRKVTIIPRGMALGLTWTMPDDEQLHVSRNHLLARIAMTLGGRAAEELIYGDMYTGASDDLQKVTSLARKLVTVFGMSKKLGPLTFGKRNEHVFMGRDFGQERDYGEAVAETIDSEVRELVETQYQYAKKLLADNRDIMDAIVKTLLEKETLEESEVQKIIAHVKSQRNASLSNDEQNGKLPVVDTSLA
jgi:cell division protease FtsH